jgi:hypothetical protein
MPYETAYLRARAAVARTLAARARDLEIAKLLVQISEEFEEEALLREISGPRSSEAGPLI